MTRGGPGGPAAARGNDWLDGAFAGWLLVSALQAGRGAAGGGALAFLAGAAGALLLAGAVFPLFRFRPTGWWMAWAGVLLLAAWTLLGATGAAPAPRSAPHLLPDLLALGYLLHLRPEYRQTPSAPPPGVDAARDVEGEEAAEAPASPSVAPTPATDPGATPFPTPDPAGALAAIHRRIVATGSACAVKGEEAREIAARHGVAPSALAREGAALHATFLAHFRARGGPDAAEARELACLARLLGLAPEGEAGGGEAGPVRPLPRTGAPLEAGERTLAAREVELYRIPAAPTATPRDARLRSSPRPLTGCARAGRCRFVVTDRRLLLVAPAGKVSPLPLERIAATAVFPNGIEIRPHRGPALFLHFEEGVAETAAALDHARDGAAARPRAPSPHPKDTP